MGAHAGSSRTFTCSAPEACRDVTATPSHMLPLPPSPSPRPLHLVVIGVRGEQAAVHHGLDVLVAGQRRGGGLLLLGHRVAHARVLHRLDLRGQPAHLARVQRVHLGGGGGWVGLHW